jgi:hypothetical protein
MARMFHAVLICSDEECALEVEAWGEPAELDLLLCEGCGCMLQVLEISEAAPVAAAPAAILARAA